MISQHLPILQIVLPLLAAPVCIFIRHPIEQRKLLQFLGPAPKAFTRTEGCNNKKCEKKAARCLTHEK